jgi:hypothetical protein
MVCATPRRRWTWWDGLWTAARPQRWPQSNHTGSWLSTNSTLQLANIMWVSR